MLDSVGMLKFLHGSWTKNITLMEPLVMRTGSWHLHFVTPEYLNHMQNYMMLLKHCDHTVVKVLASVTWLLEDHIKVCLVTWLGYSFAFLWNFLPSIFSFDDFWSSMFCIVLFFELAGRNVIKELGVFTDCNVQGYSFCPPKKPTKQAFWCTRNLH